MVLDAPPIALPRGLEGGVVPTAPAQMALARLPAYPLAMESPEMEEEPAMRGQAWVNLDLLLEQRPPGGAFFGGI